MAKRTDIAERTILRMLTHRAGVEQDKIRVIDIIGHLVTHLAQHAADTLGICFVLLTAKGVSIGAQLLAAVQRRNRIDIGKLALQLLVRNGNRHLCASFYRNGVPSAVKTFRR